jgi:hypothetical protein
VKLGRGIDYIMARAFTNYYYIIGWFSPYRQWIGPYEIYKQLRPHCCQGISTRGKQTCLRFLVMTKYLG